jgi:hypothetical protein
MYTYEYTYRRYWNARILPTFAARSSLKNGFRKKKIVLNFCRHKECLFLKKSWKSAWLLWTQSTPTEHTLCSVSTSDQELRDVQPKTWKMDVRFLLNQGVSDCAAQIFRLSRQVFTKNLLPKKEEKQSVSLTYAVYSRYCIIIWIKLMKKIIKKTYFGSNFFDGFLNRFVWGTINYYGEINRNHQPALPTGKNLLNHTQIWTMPN